MRELCAGFLTHAVLFLNKVDLFRAKLERSPISNYFPDFHGGSDYDKATAYFTQRFTSLNQSPSKTIYPHLTCATDTRHIQRILSSVNDIVIQVNLRDCGLL